MTADGFRRLALALPDTIESAHMNHPDFRVRGRIFCTLGYPDDTCGMVVLSIIDQDLFVQADSKAFMPVPGAWGRKGSTRVHLAAVRVPLLKKALAAAWQNTVDKAAKPAARATRKKPAPPSGRRRSS